MWQKYLLLSCLRIEFVDEKPFFGLPYGFKITLKTTIFQKNGYASEVERLKGLIVAICKTLQLWGHPQELLLA